MSGHTKWSKLRDDVLAKPGAKERIAQHRVDTLEEIRLYELRHAQAVSQIDMAGRLEVTQGAISKFEHAEDVRVSTLREYLDALGARLELVAVFDDDGDRRVPVHLGKAAKTTGREPLSAANPSTGSSTGPAETGPNRATRASTLASRKRTSEARTSTRRNRPASGPDHS